MHDKLCKTPSDFLTEVSYYTPGNCDIRVGSLNCHGLELADTSSGLLKFINIAWFFLATDMDFLFLQDTQHLVEGREVISKLRTILTPSYQSR